MKKTISLSGFDVILFIAIVVQIFLLIFLLGNQFFDFVEVNGNVVLHVSVVSLSLFFHIWTLNRRVSIVWLDDGVVKSRGLIYGFYKECSVVNIKSVEIRYDRYMGKYIYLIDDSKFKYDSIRKNSYICFKKTNKNLGFLRAFWFGEVVLDNS